MPVPVEFDQREEILRGIVVGLHFEHPCKSQSNLEEGPAIDAVKVHGRGFGMIINLQGVVDVRRSEQGPTDRDCPVSKRQRTPLLPLSFLNKSLKLRVASENPRVGQIDASLQVGEGCQKQQDRREQDNLAHKRAYLAGLAHISRKIPSLSAVAG